MDLPQEVIIHILSFLDVRDLLFIDSVPKSDYLLGHPKLWISVDFQRVASIRDDVIDMMGKNAKQVKTLVMNGPSYFVNNQNYLQHVMSLMSNLEYLDISMCNVLNDMHFLLHTSKLTHLVLDCMNILTTDSLLNYLPQCTSLRTLSFKGNRFLAMSEVTEICTQLVQLSFLDTQGTCDFTAGSVEQILRSCQQRNTFYFNSFHYLRMYTAWVRLVNVDFSHVTFHYTTYQQITRFERILARNGQM